MSRAKHTLDVKISASAIKGLKKLIKVQTDAELANFLGITPANISNAGGPTGKGFIPYGWIRETAKKLGLSTDEVEKKAMEQDHDISITKPQETTNSIIPTTTTPYVEIFVPYGPTGDGETARYRIVLEIIQNWVDDVFPVPQRKALIAWVIDSDNLAPELPANSFVLIDTGQHELKTNGVFAFQVQNHMIFRRIFLRIDGRVDLVNDNRVYPSNNMPLAELVTDPRVKVVGKVVFKGLKMY